MATSNIGLSEEAVEKIFKAASEQSYVASGAGSKFSQIPLLLSRFDKWGYNILVPNQELPGFTFFTRPQLNLSTSNLRVDPTMSVMSSLNPQTYAFAARCLLDPLFADRVSGSNSRMVDFNNPFIVPISNCMTNIGGFPNFTLEMETTEGGLYGEDLTFVKGGDNGARTYDISVTIRDIQGGFIFTLMLTWLRYMLLVSRGAMVPYPNAINENFMDYTCSIYRFTMDPTKRYIRHWAKLTGCIPRELATGDMFNITEGQYFVEGLKEFTIPFVANHFSPNDPSIFLDFNRLVENFCPDIASRSLAPHTAEGNFRGIPYIDVKSGNNQLVWMVNDDEYVDTLDETYDEYRSSIQSAIAAYESASADRDGVKLGTSAVGASTPTTESIYSNVG